MLGPLAREARRFGARRLDAGGSPPAMFRSMLRMLRLFFATLVPTLSARRSRGPLRPSWSFMFEWMIRVLRRDWDETADWSLPAQRALVASRPYPSAFVRRVQVRRDVLGGVPCVVFTPPASVGAARIVYLHGGSYVYGSCGTSHADVCARLALATSLPVVGVEYRLAPEHPWSVQRDDAVAVCRALADAPIVLAGDSAGGHLAVETAFAVSVTALVLLSPWVDLEMPGRSFVDNDAFDWGTRAVLLRHAQAVAGTAPPGSLALQRHPLRELPPTLVSVGEAELPRDDILAFANALRDAGVDCTLHVAPDMPHNPALFAEYHPAAKEAFDAAVEFVRRETRRSEAPAVANSRARERGPSHSRVRPDEPG
jgi:acetyl esterase/lipase